MTPNTPGVLAILALVFAIQACEQPVKPPAEKDIVPPAKLSERILSDIRQTLDYARSNNGRVNDSVTLAFPSRVDSLYKAGNFQPFWTEEDRMKPVGLALLKYIAGCREAGLFPSDYEQGTFAFVQRVFDADTTARKNAAIYARRDILMTDAFFRLVKDLKRGRLPFDSTTLRKDSLISPGYYDSAFARATGSGQLASVLGDAEPHTARYDSIRSYVGDFLAHADFSPYTKLDYPYTDSVAFFEKFEARLKELHELDSTAAPFDSAAKRAAILRYQRKYNFKNTGLASEALVDRMNYTDEERFRTIALNLDRCKLLPDSLPPARVWVNLPSFTLQVYAGDTLVFESKVIVGSPSTRSPVLTGEISNFITMPQWTVPYSIIFKEMLGRLKAHKFDFLEKENLMIVNDNDSVLDPAKINWSKMSKTRFPYQIKQRQGDDNSLGVIKFNFRNKYDVYLHDTNARGLFAKSFRALSHGCIRVKEWNRLANYLVRTDSLKYPADTLKAWIARQEKHVVSGFPRVPVLIRYFTCEGKDGRLKFYDDIYEDDKHLIRKYFRGRVVE